MFTKPPPKLLVQILRGDEAQPGLGQIPGGMIGGRDLVEEVELNVLSIAVSLIYFFSRKKSRMSEMRDCAGIVLISLRPRSISMQRG
jgi:hypothetical protein